MYGMMLDRVTLLVVLNPAKQDSLMMPIIVVHVRQNLNGLLRTADAPENAMKLLMLFLMKAKMLIFASVSKDTSGTHLLAVFRAVAPLILVTL